MSPIKLTSQFKVFGLRAGHTVVHLGFLSLIGLFILVASGGQISAKQQLVVEHQFDLLGWELSHVGDKWWHEFMSFLRINSQSTPTDQAVVREYLNGTRKVRILTENLEQNLLRPSVPQQPEEDIRIELGLINQRLKSIQPDVERILEHAITVALEQLQIPGKIGGVRWPPVDFTFTRPLSVLVTSPEEKIVRLDDVLLKHDLQLRTIRNIERMVESQLGLSTLVVPIGGVATYPAQVRLNESLTNVLTTASHEWVHHYLFFRPLGFNWNSTAEMVTINETVAGMLGKEISTKALAGIVDLLGNPIEIGSPVNSPSATVSFSERFHFQREMKKTRARLDQLLEDGRIDDAKMYLEDRRSVFLINGYAIRKLNNAYFAFYGSYGDSYVSGNPIAAQLMAIRRDSAGAGEFLSKVSEISNLGDLEILALVAGWDPTED